MSQTPRQPIISAYTFLELVKFFSASLSLFFIVYAILFRTIFFLLPTSPDLDKNVFKISDIQYNLILVFIMLGVSWFISYRQKKISIVNPLVLPKEELFALFIASLLLAYFFTRSFSLLSTLSNNNFVIAIFTVFFFTYLTQIIEFYNYYYSELNINALKYYLSNIFSKQNIISIKNTLSFATIFIVLVGYGIFSSLVIYHQSSSYKSILKEDLFIVRVVPPKTTVAYTVKLIGYNFGRVPDQRYKLYSTYGQVYPERWSDNMIEFVVPLSWKVGNVELWIERPNLRGENRTITSNVAELTVLNRWDFFPTQNENFFVRASKKLLRVTYLEFWNNLESRLTFLK